MGAGTGAGSGSPARRHSVAIAVGVVVIAGVAPASAPAATTVGEIFPPDVQCVQGRTWVQTSSPGDAYAVPAPGVITSWSYRSAGTPAQLNFKVVRPVGANDFTIVGDSGLRTSIPNIVNTFPVRIPVERGDVIGFFTATQGDCGRSSPPGSGYANHDEPGDPAAGSTVFLGGPYPGLQLTLAATLELDCDNDGFGDETQDTDLTPCDTSPPDATITKGPKDKTKKKQATFEFSAADPRAVAGFECSLDGAAFAACTSPVTVKVKKGKHTFSVRAIDQAGNVDGTPATDEWKVKKKRKRGK